MDMRASSFTIVLKTPGGSVSSRYWQSGALPPRGSTVQYEGCWEGQHDIAASSVELHGACDG